MSNFFCLRGPKNFVREPFCVSQNFWYKKTFMDRRGVGYHVFPSKDFVSHSTEKFPRGTLVFQKGYGVEFFLIIGVPRFCRFFLSHTAKNFRRGALLCFRMFRASKHFVPKRGTSRLCFEKMLSHSTEKIRRWTFLSFSKWYPRTSWQRGGREYHIFRQKFLV